MEQEPEAPEKISLYNSGVAQIKRLDDLWIKTHLAVQKGELKNWNWLLDRVWVELVGDLIEGDEQTKAREEEFNAFRITLGNINREFASGKLSPVAFQTQFYDELMAKETFLRRLQNKLGKGTKLVDADEDEIE